METLPYFLIIGLIIGFSILLFGLDVFSQVSDLSSKAMLSSQVKQMKEKIGLLESSSYGSFDYIDFEVPNKCTIYSNGTLTCEENYDLGVKFSCLTSSDFNCKDRITLKKGRYRLLLYHGDRFEAKYCLCFT